MFPVALLRAKEGEALTIYKLNFKNKIYAKKLLQETPPREWSPKE